MMCTRGTMTLVTTPDWFWDARAVPENGIAIDSCIAQQILDAWAAGVRTRGSCCGHGNEPPSVVLTDGHHPEADELARRQLPGFTLYQWRLIDVTHETD